LEITIPKNNKTILSNILEQTNNIEFGCKEGFCGLCRLKFKNKEDFYYFEEPLAFIENNEFLPCITKSNNEFKLKLG
jgi:ferredoxin